VPCPKCGSTSRKNAALDRGAGTDKARKDEVARELAKMHYEIESELTHVYRITGRPEAEVNPAEPIKLLEVNAATVASGVMPLRFAPAPAIGIPYPSIIIEVTPDEFEMLGKQELNLPEGWEIGDLIPRPAANGEE
jgi:hypothetical protein